jgi:hypothetical protein
MRETTLKAAIGNRDGDYLTLENQWARVHVTREEVDTTPKPSVQYFVTGESECARTGFTSLGAAVEHAAKVLKLYTDGRCD